MYVCMYVFQTIIIKDYNLTAGSARPQRNLASDSRVLQLSSLQGDVQEEVQEEEWSDSGRHPPRHCAATKPCPCCILHIMFTSDFI